MRVLLATVSLLAGAACCDALPSSSGGGEALELHGGARFSTIVRSPLLESGRLQDGFSVAYWFRLSEPGLGYSRSDSSTVAGYPSVIWQLWTQHGSTLSYSDNPIVELAVGSKSMLFQASEEVSQAGRNHHGGRHSWFHTVVSWNASASRFVVAQDAGTDLEQTFEALGEDDAAGLVAELSAVSASLSRTSAFFTIGSSYLGGTLGEIDDFCVLDRAVAAEEAAAIRARGCLGAADLLSTAGLGSYVLHYSFDLRPGGSDSPLFDSIAGIESGMMGSIAIGPRGEKFDAISCDVCDLAPLARSVLSSAPVPAGQLRFVRPAAASATDLEMVCGTRGGSNNSGDGNVVLDVLPTDGLTCVYIGDDAAASAALSAAGNTACDASEPARWRVLFGTGSELLGSWRDGRVLLRFVASAESAPRTRNDFNGSCSGVPFAATIVTNSRPWLINSTIDVDERTGISMYLPGDHSLFGDAETPANELVVQIDSVVSIGPVELYHDPSMADLAIGRVNQSSSCDSQAEAPSVSGNYSRAATELLTSYVALEQFACAAYRLSGPHVLEPGQRLAYLRAALATSSDPASLRIVYRVFDGIEYSDAAELVVQVVQSNQPPHADSRTEPDVLAAREDTAILIELGDLVSDREGDAYLTFVERLPVFGALYAFEGPTFTGSERRIELASDGIPLHQWVANGTELASSSAYPDGDCNVEEVVGEPDFFPRATMDLPSWQPADVSTEQWVELIYAKAVFAREVSLYQLFSPGACVRVDALPENSDEWTTLWEGENQERSWCPEKWAAALAAHESPYCSGISRYQLFPVPFRTRRIRLTFQVADTWSSWPTLDAVLLTGVEKSDDRILASPRLWFLPGPDAVGRDNFTFTALDRSLFYSVGTLSKDKGEVELDVAPVDDPPELELARPGADGPVLRCGVDSSAVLLLAAREADGDDITLSLIRPPALGEVSLSLSDMQPEGRSSLARNATVSVVFVADCAALSEVTSRIGFVVAAADPGGLSANLSVTATVLKENKSIPSRVLQSCMIAMFGLVVTLAMLAARWVVKFRHLQVVRVAQVPFLLVFLAGVILNSTAILAIQYNDVNSSQATADLACNWLVWAYVAGFNVTFTSLLVKLDRAERLTDQAFLSTLQYGEAGAKRWAKWQVSASGMTLRMLQFFLVDAAFIVACCYNAPITYQRRTLYVDLQHKYTLSSSGMCTGENFGILVGLIGGFHVVILAYVAHMCQRSRNIHDALSEHKTLTRLLWSNLQILALAVPVIVLTRDDAVSNTFVIATVIAITNAMSVVLLIGPRVMLKIRVRDGSVLTVDTMRREDEDLGKDRPLGLLSAVWSGTEAKAPHSVIRGASKADISKVAPDRSGTSTT